MPRNKKEACEECGTLTAKSALYLSPEFKWRCLKCQPEGGAVNAAMDAFDSWEARKPKPHPSEDPKYDGLIYTTREMEPCPFCKGKTGSYVMCKECLERRELRGVVERAGLLKFCSHCGDQGQPKVDCPRHGR